MLLLRSCRRKACDIKALSQTLSILSRNLHIKNKYETYLSKLSAHQSSKIYCNLLGVHRFYSTENSSTNENLHSPEQYHSLKDSDSFDTEHLNVTNHSEENVENFRKVNNIVVRGDDVPKPIMHFSELNLPGHLKEVLRQEKYSDPTPIQAQGWPVAFSGRDMVGVSQTGSGKTLAYMLPAVLFASNTSSIQGRYQRHQIPSPKVLVLGPTRELVQQILDVSRKYIQASGLRGSCVYGGASRIPQLNKLRGVDICIATPGRLLDYLQNRETSLENCSYLVLDEADRMLDMGFEPQIRDIVKQIPSKRQTLMWSATWPNEIQNLAEEFLDDYIHITIGDADLTANPNIEQNIYVVEEGEKLEKVFSLITEIMENKPSKILVFAETKRKVNFLTHYLEGRGLKVYGIHGDYSQNQRDRVLRNFRMNPSSILIATDIASRGLDITDIQHVFNYDFPTNIEDYIHRIGRTARGSACGKSHSLFTSEDFGVLKDLINVLQKAKQQINPELYNLIENAPRRYKPKKNNFNSSFGKNRTFYGNKPMYGRSRFTNDRNRIKYEKEERSYM